MARPRKPNSLTLLGPAELAEFWGVTRGAIRQLRRRGQLPRPDLVLSGMEVWTLATIENATEESGGDG
jgi:hypothetical protein